jgi:NADH:ubiquinone oxidoreductase subunit
MATPRPSLKVAVVMEREAQPTRWEEWRHSIVDVVPHQESFGESPRVLREDDRITRTLHPGLDVTLYTDEGEGYYLNLSSGNPVWFVMWRIHDEDPSKAWPEMVTLSYNEAGRLLDAQERVDNVPLPPELAGWLQAFTDEHYKPEPKQRKRPASFLAPDKRGPR